MKTASEVAQKERSELVATSVAFGVSIALLLITAFRVLVVKKGFDHSVAGVLGGDAANTGTVGFDVLSGGQLWLFGAGEALKVVSLIALSSFLLRATVIFIRTRTFTPLMLKLYKVGSISLLLYFVGAFLSNMGANSVASSYGVTNPFPVIPNYEFVIAYVFLMTLSFIAVTAQRAVKLEEEQEGLV